MEILNADTFKTKIHDYENQKVWAFQGPLPTIIDFFADWCAPCRALSPILEEIADEYQGQVQIYKVDTQATPELAALFEVRSIPSILFIPKEGEPAMATGLMPKESFYNAISDLFGVPRGGAPA